MGSVRKTNRTTEEAAQWLVRLEESDAPQHRAAFIGWLKHSPRHVEELLLTDAAYRRLDGLDTQRRVDIHKLMAQSSADVVALQEEPLTPTLSHKGRGGKRWVWGVAAVLTGALVATLWFARSLPLLAGDLYTTTIGEQRSVQLSDGSVIHLNTQSRVDVRFSGSERKIRLLEGEALFVVARDASRPFRVTVDKTVVQAVGTQFDVYRRKDSATVSVVEGRVQIFAAQRSGLLTAPAPHATSTLLDAGEEARVTLGRILKRATPNREDTLAWRQRQMVFRSDTLAHIAEEFNRYNRTQIRFADPAVAARRLSGVVHVDDLDSLLGFLNGDQDLTFDHDLAADKVTIQKSQ